MTSVTNEQRFGVPVVLGAIGGMLEVLGGLVLLAMASFYTPMFGWHRMLGMMMYSQIFTVVPPLSQLFIWVSFFTIACGCLMVYSSYGMYRIPSRGGTFAVVLLATSLVGIFAGNGFWFGSILGIAGGLLALWRRK